MTLLQVERLSAGHGLLQAVRDVSLELEAGQTLALVGANGAGKSTLLRSIAGVHRPTSGSIKLEGRDVTNIPAHRRVRLGVALVLEGRRLFPGLTVEENLRVAAATRPGPWNVDSILEAFPNLQQLRRRTAGTLSGGEQQATAIGRALMSNPSVLLLDEVSLGLSPAAVDLLYASLQKVRAQGSAVVLVEQDLGRALDVADRVVCMLEGRFVLEAKGHDLSYEQVTRAYFGLDRSVAADAQ